MIIYLACTVRGDRAAITPLRSLVTSLEGSGHIILTKHLLDGDVETVEGRLSERAVYERDIEWLDACDLLVADASGSSFGVGFEVGYVLGRADRTNQRVLLLYRKTRRDAISRMIVGNAHPSCRTIEYDDADDLARGVLEALAGL